MSFGPTSLSATVSSVTLQTGTYSTTHIAIVNEVIHNTNESVITHKIIAYSVTHHRTE